MATGTKTRRQKPELHSTDLPLEQPPDVELSLEQAYEDPPMVEAVDKPLDKQHADALAFMEEPVQILIHEGSEPDAAPVADYCAVNGKRAEVLLNGRWIESSGYLPRGVTLTLKRKYVEALARPKLTQVRTEIKELPNQDPLNLVRRSNRVRCPIQIVHDPSLGKGHEWFQRIVAMNY